VRKTPRITAAVAAVLAAAVTQGPSIRSTADARGETKGGPLKLKQIVTTAKQMGERWAGIPGIEVTKKGRLLVVWFSGGAKEPAPENCVYMAISDTGGATFGKPVKTADVREGARAYDPTLWLAPNGVLWLVFNRSNRATGLQGIFARTCTDPDEPQLQWSKEFHVGSLSRDEGRTWSQGLMLDERKSVSYPDAALAPDGTIYAVHDRNRNGAGEILLSVFRKEDIP